MCHYRAENLSYHFAELGYRTKTIRISHAPTLIAMERDSEGKLNGDYEEYGSGHTLVQIDVEFQGKTIQYFLDPQYMNKALPKEDYFKKTIGQNCQKLKSEDDTILDFTKCYYLERKQNATAEDLVTLFHTANSEVDRPYLNCGWASGHKAKNINEYPVLITSTKKDRSITSTNYKTPEKFKGKQVTDSTSKDLIWENYSTYEDRLKEQLVFAYEQEKITKDTLSKFTDKSSDFYSEQLDTYNEWKKRKEQIEFSIKKVPEMKERVKLGLKELNDK